MDAGLIWIGALFTKDVVYLVGLKRANDECGEYQWGRFISDRSE